jgi:hypothetical protein
VTQQRSDNEMRAKAQVMRVRTEANVVRAMWLNKVLPIVEGELNRRLAEGEPIEIGLPEVDTFAEQYLEALGFKALNA